MAQDYVLENGARLAPNFFLTSVNLHNDTLLLTYIDFETLPDPYSPESISFSNLTQELFSDVTINNDTILIPNFVEQITSILAEQFPDFIGWRRSFSQTNECRVYLLS